MQSIIYICYSFTYYTLQCSIDIFCIHSLIHLLFNHSYHTNHHLTRCS
nr:MAG TPA: hypothetical protein [Bacteriophage sp.]